MDAIEPVTPEQPIAPSPEPETPAEPPLTLAEHAAEYTKPKAGTPPETPAEKTARQEAAAQQRRDKQTGQFDTGRVRHRAKSQQASPDDVPRIAALTGRAKTAEEKADRLERELAELRAKPVSPAPVTSTVDVKSADDPEPDPDDPKYGGDYAKGLRDVARWEARQVLRSERQAERDAQQAETKKTQQEAVLKGFAERITAAREKHADFDAVALSGTTKIPEGSTIDLYIMEDEVGPEILYHLQQHPDEIDHLLGMSVLQQNKQLALLSQRLAGTSPQQAGPTGSAAGPRVVVLPPKPPNPVRTEAQRAVEPPIPTDGSLSVAAHARTFGQTRYRK